MTGSGAYPGAIIPTFDAISHGHTISRVFRFRRCPPSSPFVAHFRVVSRVGFPCPRLVSRPCKNFTVSTWFRLTYKTGSMRGGGLEGNDLASLVAYLDMVCLRFVFPDSSLVSILSALLPGRIQKHMRHQGGTLNIVHTSASFPKHRFLVVRLRRLWLCV